MTKYPLVALGDILVRSSDTVPIAPDQMYRTAGLLNRGRGMFAREPQLGASTKYRTYNKIRAGQVIYSKLFGWEGSVAVVPPEFDGYHVSSEFPTFDIKTDMATPAYLSHLTRWTGLHDMMAISTTGLGQRRQRVQVGQFLSLKIPLPEDTDEQQRIVVRLDQMHNARQAAAVAATQARSTVRALRDITCGRVGSQTPLREVLEQSYDLISIDPEQVYKTAGLLNRGRGMFAREPQLGASTKYRTYNKIRAGQVIYSKLFGWEGSVAVVPPEFDGYHVSSEFPTFDIKTDMATPAYLSHLTRWTGLHDMMAISTTGLGQRRQRVQVGQFLSLKIPLPEDTDEQWRIALLLDQANEVLQCIEDRERLFDAWVKSALDHAFNGLA